MATLMTQGDPNSADMSTWRMGVDPATRVLLDVLRRLNPGVYREAQVEAQRQVDNLLDGVIRESPGEPVDFQELRRRLDLSDVEHHEPPPSDT